MRWGRILQCMTNRLKHAIEIVYHIPIPKTDNTIAISRQFSATESIGGDSLSMLSAIEFDHEVSRWTREIGNALADRVLAAKFPSPQTLFQCVPQEPLDFGPIASKLTRDDCRRPWRPHPPPHPALSAPGGGEGLYA